MSTHNDTKDDSQKVALQFLRSCTNARRTEDVVRLALQCLADNVFLAYKSNCRPAVRNPSTDGYYLLSLEPLGNRGAPESQQSSEPPAGISELVERLKTLGADGDSSEIVRMATSVFLHIACRLCEGWEFVWVLPNGSLEKKEVHGIKKLEDRPISISQKLGFNSWLEANVSRSDK